LELRQACPCGNYRLTQDSSTRKPGSNNYKGKSTVIGACAGFTQGGAAWVWVGVGVGRGRCQVAMAVSFGRRQQRQDQGAAAGVPGGWCAACMLGRIFQLPAHLAASCLQVLKS
jgi:hypothetical protein